MDNNDYFQNSCLCINMRHITNVITKLYDKYLEPSGLTVSQYSLLRHIQRYQPCSIETLASSMFIDRTTISRTLKPLAPKGLFEDISPENSRCHMYQLTEKGEQFVTEARKLWLQAQSKIETTLGPENTDALVALLSELSVLENIDDEQL
ncbi:MAG: winged helix-turn-helix transcriptional regulator [Firmicutes bacterium]|nr:winged helix-turn-helix transcriptional regulator [Bacillota bacterium]